jgi:hypothetical protein
MVLWGFLKSSKAPVRKLHWVGPKAWRTRNMYSKGCPRYQNGADKDTVPSTRHVITKKICKTSMLRQLRTLA